MAPEMFNGHVELVLTDWPARPFSPIRQPNTAGAVSATFEYDTDTTEIRATTEVTFDLSGREGHANEYAIYDCAGGLLAVCGLPASVDLSLPTMLTIEDVGADNVDRPVDGVLELLTDAANRLDEMGEQPDAGEVRDIRDSLARRYDTVRCCGGD